MRMPDIQLTLPYSNTNPMHAVDTSHQGLSRRAPTLSSPVFFIAIIFSLFMCISRKVLSHKGIDIGWLLVQYVLHEVGKKVP